VRGGGGGADETDTGTFLLLGDRENSQE